MAEFQLKDVGRHKVNGRVCAMSEDALMKEVRKHLLSTDVEITWDDAMLIGVIYAGGREAGRVERLSELV